MRVMFDRTDWAASSNAVDHGGISRREFCRNLGVTAAGLFASSSLLACGDHSNPDLLQPSAMGSVAGSVLDLQGTPQPGLGHLILLYGSGRQVGVRVSPDSRGLFRIDDLPPQEYQFRYSAPGVAFIPEPFPHPVRFMVEAGKTTQLTIRVQRGVYSQNLVEIYAGEAFFQLQPDGQENAEATVRLGTNVCWYNVGTMVHTVTGGPWIDSGDLQKSQAFLWTADRLGVFPYQCRHHLPIMTATLRVIAAGA